VTAELDYENIEPRVRAINEAFQQKWERFRYFVLEPSDPKFIEHLKAEWSNAASLLDMAVGAKDDLEKVQVELTGKKSELAAFKKEVGRFREEQRRNAGQAVKHLEISLSDSLRKAEDNLQLLVNQLRTQIERIDVTLPGRRPRRGHLHPITIVRERIEDIFVSLGYAIEDGREIETDFYNFDALNIPDNHPARASQDTFYTTDGFALRSQTSTVQIHAMQRRGAPLRMIAPGRVFRRDTPDPTHNPMFFQVEGLCVDRGISMAHLKGTVAEFLRRMFGAQTVTRFRPSYFPFTEPSAEFDFSCFKCGGAGCRICKNSGWIELGGSGMVHPNVLRGAGVDPEEFSGFAFGLGIDRMVALMYGLDDIRLLFENDVRFLEQFD
jgi:phenylalanyl-tRNA synthetase alpha chain